MHDVLSDLTEMMTDLIVGLWTRGDQKDYDAWAEMADDDNWSWSGFLFHFRKTQHPFSPLDSSLLKNHRYNGEVHTASVSASGCNYT